MLVNWGVEHFLAVFIARMSVIMPGREPNQLTFVCAETGIHPLEAKL